MIQDILGSESVNDNSSVAEKKTSKGKDVVFDPKKFKAPGYDPMENKKVIIENGEKKVVEGIKWLSTDQRLKPLQDEVNKKYLLVEEQRKDLDKYWNQLDLNSYFKIVKKYMNKFKNNSDAKPGIDSCNKVLVVLNEFADSKKKFSSYTKHHHVAESLGVGEPAGAFFVAIEKMQQENLDYNDFVKLKKVFDNIYDEVENLYSKCYNIINTKGQTLLVYRDAMNKQI